MNPLEEEEERWPDEPEEFDPDSLGPEPPNPTGNLEEALNSSEEIPDGLFRAFWASALLLNVALGAFALGVMLIYFQGNYDAGVPALLVGSVAGFGTVRYYWGVKTGQYTIESDGGEPEGGKEP